MKTNIKLFAFLTCLITSLQSFAYDFSAVNSDGVTIYYNILSSEEKTCEVTWGILEYTESVNIPSSVTYSGSTYSVTSIEGTAFKRCTGLTSVTIPNSITYIGDRAFFECTGLTTVNFNPTNCTRMGTIVNGYLAFYGCTNITTVNIGENVQNIPDLAFCQCSKITTLTIPNSVISIGAMAFKNCSGLTSVTIGDSVTTIDDHAFNGCSGLTSITIPHSVTSIGWYAFYGCTGLKTINFNATNCYYMGGDRLAFGECYIKSVTIGENVQQIPSYAFEGCAGLSMIVIPESVQYIGGNAFKGCTGIKSVIFNAINCSHTSEASMFEPNVTKFVFGDKVRAIPNYTCCGLTNLISISIPNSTTSIGDHAFDGCEGLTSITIPTSITSIGNGAFYRCTGLTSVEIPNTVTSIGNSTFSGCSWLTSVTIPRSITSIGDFAFQSCGALKDVYISDISAWCNIDFGTNVGIFDLGNLEANPLSYAENLYLNNSKITALTIPENVSNIKNYAFSYSSITSLSIPNSVTAIGKKAFYKCTKLKGIYISDISAWCNIDFADMWANPLYEAEKLYLNNSEITKLTIPESVTKIKDYAFYKCMGLTSVTIGNSVNSIGNEAFEYCTGLTSVTIPNSVTSIGRNAFSGCTHLESIISRIKKPSNVPLGENVFNDVPKSTCVLYVPKGCYMEYLTTEQWTEFLNIEEKEISGIEDVVADKEFDGTYVVYDLNGILKLTTTDAAEIRNTLDQGIYIINGKKVLIR